MIGKSESSVVILGAGPGDPELITVKGMNILRSAQVILYDALVSAEILLYADASCKMIFVGKRRGKKEFSQSEINRLLYFYAHRYANVVRLKGGDPYVFGRGHEELEYLVNRGIHTKVIPGISSALAAPQSAGIPLTKRGVNESFWVVTATVTSGSLGSDLQLAARSSATLIILMGFTHLCDIANLITKSRSPQEPIAVIQSATCAEQKTVIATAETIVDEVKKHRLETPAVIIVGNVVNEQPKKIVNGFFPNLSKSEIL